MKKLMAIMAMGIILVSCQSKAKKEAEIAAAKQMVVDSINRAEAEKVRIQDSMQAIAMQQKREKEVIIRHESDAPASDAGTTKKKGWSSTAKGAVIGAGAGALTGALVSKKKGEGAIIGGVLGAGAGAGVGAIIDGKKKKAGN